MLRSDSHPCRLSDRPYFVTSEATQNLGKTSIRRGRVGINVKCVRELRTLAHSRGSSPIIPSRPHRPPI